jgi:nucleoside-diphosphate-sugar epimerase
MPGMAPPRDRVSLAGRRVLVTGARGFLGSHLMLALAAAGADAHAFQGDITDAEAVRAEVSGIGPDLVFHMAAYGTTPIQRDEARMREVNVGGTKHLWEALDRQPCRVVQTGTCGEYGPAIGALAEHQICRPATAFTQTMHEAVLFSLDRARHSGRELIVLRPFGPYGPDDRSERLVPHVIDGLLSGGRVATTSGQQRRDHSHVSDHIRALMLAGTRTLADLPAVFNVGTGRPIRVRDLIETIATVIGDGALARVDFGAVPLRPNDLSDMFADTTAARRLLGYEPAMALEDGLSRTIAWHRTARVGLSR